MKSKFTKGVMGLLVAGWLGMGAMDAMAGGMGFGPPSNARYTMAPIYPRAMLPRFPPVAYRFAPPANRPMWAWSGPRKMASNRFFGPMRWQGAPARTAYPAANYGLAQLPYPVRMIAPYRPPIINQMAMAQQAYRQAPQVDPLQGRHWVAAR